MQVRLNETAKPRGLRLYFQAVFGGCQTALSVLSYSRNVENIQLSFMFKSQFLRTKRSFDRFAREKSSART